MTFQIVTLYLKPGVHLTGVGQKSACRQTLAALSAQLRATSFLQITLEATQAKSELLIGLPPTATSLEVSTSSTIHEPLFPHSESLPYTRYLTTSTVPSSLAHTPGWPCDILTLRFPPSTSSEQQHTCLKALEYLLSASDDSPEDTDLPSPCLGKIAGYMKEEFGIAGDQSGVYRAYILWESREEEVSFKARHGGRHLWSRFNEIGNRDWKTDIGFYDALEEVWATEGVDVESGWIRQIRKAEYMTRPARAISNAVDWMSSLGSRHRTT